MSSFRAIAGFLCLRQEGTSTRKVRTHSKDSANAARSLPAAAHFLVGRSRTGQDVLSTHATIFGACLVVIAGFWSLGIQAMQC